MANFYKRPRRKRRLMGEINITPFVDVSLVLLIIFMIAAPLMNVGVKVNLPKTNAKSIDNNEIPININILSDGKLFIDNRPIDSNNLLAEISKLSNNNLGKRIFIRGDASVNYGVIMQIMANINSAGYNNIGLITSKPSEP